jgi:6-phosphogluconolactonase
MSVQIEVVENPARACAAMLVSAVSDGGQIVLAGGSTPRRAYEDFVQNVRSADLQLSATTFWFGDERCVSPDDSRSNYLMAKQSLLDALGDAGPGAVHRMEGELGPDDAASAYEELLRSAGPVEFDLLLLGIGPDGHTASMFPDQQSLSERTRLVVGVPEAGLEPFVPRVTLTLPGLALAKHIVFLASGESKADAVARAFGKDARPDPHVPSSMVPMVAQRVTLLLDQAAAGRL